MQTSIKVQVSPAFHSAVSEFVKELEQPGKNKEEKEELTKEGKKKESNLELALYRDERMLQGSSVRPSPT
ncbi:hypothetical protein KOW79_003180 [Hemibagrus wyckioides]|uniref:Uncharacterized protein n=1 Tax=Hemibagrus wyckioides TaxID=337641 RepID=A0A9D3P4U6_9TELE|nr:hypothetical protein KOW79_003180 [Hemibagrus wyckioides]